MLGARLVDERRDGGTVKVRSRLRGSRDRLERPHVRGRVRHDDWQAWLSEKRVTVIGGDLDEAPQAYRRLPEVLSAHAGTIEIVHTLRPFGVVMAGANEFDPYKD